MATGTGKTYTAFQLVYRLLQSGTKKKILYLADRNNLVDYNVPQKLDTELQNYRDGDIIKITNISSGGNRK
jgi:type I site-specific restriction endonuclease